MQTRRASYQPSIHIGHHTKPKDTPKTLMRTQFVYKLKGEKHTTFDKHFADSLEQNGIVVQRRKVAVTQASPQASV